MASRFWVGGTGNWDASTTTNWSTTSGGSGGASVPTSSDDVTFDTASNATAYTVTVTATANCLNLTIGNPLAGAITFAGSSALVVAGNLSLPSGGTWSYTGQLSMTATAGTKTITSNGVSLNGYFGLVGSGGTFQLADAFRTTVNGTALQRTGTAIFDANGQDFTIATSIGGSGGVLLGTGLSFYNLTVTGSAGKGALFFINNNITVTNNLVLNGNSVTNRLMVASGVSNGFGNFTPGTNVTITAANVSVTNADFQDITGAGAGDWDLSAITGGSGDCGGNSGITFTTPATQTATGTASFTWSTHGWTSRVPLPQDDVVINNAFIAGRTVTLDMPRLGKSVTFGCTGSPTFTFSPTNGRGFIFGSLDLTGVATFTSSSNTLFFCGRSSYTFNSAGLNINNSISVQAPGGTISLSANLACGTATSRTFSLVAGTFDLANYTLTHFGTVTNTGALTRALNFGTGGVWDLTLATATTVWNASGSNFTTSGTGTIKISGSTTNIRTFAGGGFTYKDLWFSNATAAGQLTLTGSNTFSDFKAGVEGNAQTLIFTTGTTTTVTTFTVSGIASNLITINSSTTGTHALVKSGGGTISSDYLNIQHSVATPSSTWYAGTHSTNNQAVATAGSGWTFTDPPAGSSNGFFFGT